MIILEFIIIIFLLSIIHSIVGIGLLIIGTPILLAYNLSFFSTLEILLPCSLIINLINYIRSNKKEISPTYKKIFLFYCLPFVPLGLIITYFLREIINFKLIIGFLILSLFFLQIIYKKKKLSEIKQKYISILIGLFHGLTNLGGSLISLFLLVINTNNKIKTAIDFSYFFLASLQYSFLILFLNSGFKKENFIFIFISILGCLIGNLIKKYINFNTLSFFLKAMILTSAIIVIASNY